MAIFITVIILIPALDQFFKFLVKTNVAVPYETNTFLSFLKITYVKNFGAAFGSFWGAKTFLTFMPAVILLMIAYLIFVHKIRDKLFLIAAALIVGGGLSNMIDRLFLGYVVDYLKLSFFPPVCNLADYCISIGATLLIINLFRAKKYKPQEKVNF